MERRNTILVFLISLVGVFALHAHATVLQQLDYSATSSCSNGTYYATDQYLTSHSTPPLYGTLDTVSVRFVACEDFNDAEIQMSLYSSISGIQASSSEIISASSGQAFEITYPLPYSWIDMEPEDIWYFDLAAIGNVGRVSMLGSLSSSSYPFGNAQGFAPPFGIQDWYFRTEGNIYSPSSPTYGSSTAAIRIDEPIDVSMTYEFDFFVVSGTSTDELQRVGVMYGTSSGVYPYQDFTQLSTGEVGAFTTFVYKRQTLVQSVNQERNWFFKAFLYDASGETIASSSETIAFVKFSFLNVNTPTTTAPTSTNYFFIERACPSSDTFFSSTTLASAVCHIMNAIRSLGNEIGSTAEGALSRALGTAKHIFPISLIVHFQDAFNNPTVPEQKELTFLVNGVSITLFSSSSADKIASSTGIGWRDFADKVMYVFTAIIMLISAILTLRYWTTPQTPNV